MLDCATPGFNGGDIAWTTTRPAPGPSPFFVNDPQGWQLQDIFAGSTARIFVSTSYSIAVAGGTHAVGIQLDELDSSGLYLGNRALTGVGGGIFAGAWVYGDRHHVFSATILEGMGLHSDKIETDTIAQGWFNLGYKAGVFPSTVNAGGELFAVYRQAGVPSELFKLNTAGQQVFSRTVPDHVSLIPGAGGDIFLAGTQGAGFDLGCGPIAGPGAAYLARLDATGQCLWSHGIDVDYGATGYLDSLGQTADGSVILFDVHFQGTVDVGCGPLTSSPSGSTLLAKVDASGACVWSQKLDVIDPDIRLSPSGDLLVSLPFTGTIDLGGGPLTSLGTRDLAIARLDASGAHVWSERFGAPGAAFCPDWPSCGQSGKATAAADGSVVLSGPLTGWVDFGGGPLGSMVEQTYVVKLDGSGAFLWHHLLPAHTLTTVDPCGAVLCARDVGVAVGVTVNKLAP